MTSFSKNFAVGPNCNGILLFCKYGNQRRHLSVALGRRTLGGFAAHTFQSWGMVPRSEIDKARLCIHSLRVRIAPILDHFRLSSTHVSI